MAKGKFITLEGGEGAGKSTQARLLAERLRERGHKVVETREPGGSEKAETIREFLLSGEAEPYGPAGEAVLFSAARDDHLQQVIRPALERGDWVVCDRFADSTRAYQGAASGMKPGVIEALEQVVVGDTPPDLTVILDLPAGEGLKRIAAGGEGGAPQAPDRFESMDLRFHEALRRSFLDIAREEPARCAVVDARQPESAVAEAIWDAVMERLQP